MLRPLILFILLIAGLLAITLMTWERSERGYQATDIEVAELDEDETPSEESIEIEEPEAPTMEDVPSKPEVPPHPDSFLLDLTDDFFGDEFYFADFHVPDGQWRNDFVPSSVVQREDGAHLVIERAPKDRMWDWVSGSVRTKKRYGYGRYDVIMKPAKGSGLISAFFTYIGPVFNAPHDEVDIEFNGLDTTSVEFNAFRDGRPRGHKTHRLGFDASESFNHYGFEWTAETIRWFVNNEMVYEARLKPEHIPRAKSKIYLNLWTGKLYKWHGPPRFLDGTSSAIQCLSYRALEDSVSPTCADLHKPSL